MSRTVGKVGAVILSVITWSSWSVSQERTECGIRHEAALELRVLISGQLQSAALAEGVCDWFDAEKWNVHFEGAVWNPSATRASQLRGPGYPVRHLPALLIVQRATDGTIRLGYQRWGMAPLPYSEHRLPVQGPLDAMAVEEVAQAMHGIVQLQEARWIARHVTTSRGLAAARPSEALVGQELAYPMTYPSQGAAGTSLKRAKARISLGYRAIEKGEEPISSGLVVGLELPLFGREGSVTSRASFRPGGRLWNYSAVVGVGVWRSSPTRVEESLELNLSGSSLALGMALRRPLSPVEMVAMTLVSVERTVARVQQVAAESRLSPVARGISWRGFFETSLGVALPIDDFEVRLQGVLRAQLNSSPYQAQEGEAQRKLLAPRTLQPGAEVQIAYRWD